MPRLERVAPFGTVISKSVNTPERTLMSHPAIFPIALIRLVDLLVVDNFQSKLLLGALRVLVHLEVILPDAKDTGGCPLISVNLL